ncbi:MAG: GAF and ANTAR domain-containing protein [Acidimicrobiales bacterium]
MAGRDLARDDATVALTAEFAEAARALFSAGTAAGTLTQVLALSMATVEGCDFAGVHLLGPEPGPDVGPARHTNAVAADLDALQFRCGQGPAHEAIADGLMSYAEDLGTETRWPRFTPRAAAGGVRSVLALPLVVDRTLGVLTLYARCSQAFGVIDRARGLLLAALTALAFTSAQIHEEEERRQANLHAALATRELIGQAQGILIERERVTPDQAFDILRRASQHLNQKLRDVAQNLVDAGESPGWDRHCAVPPPRL